MEGFEKVAQRSEVAPGKMKVVEAQGEKIVLADLGGELIAFGNVCTDDDCDLVYDGVGEIDALGEIECDCHGSRFNVRTGEVTAPPAPAPIPVYTVQIDGDDILVGPR